MRYFLISFASIIVGVVAASETRAACTGCQGDVGVKLTKTQFWGSVFPSQYSKHTHSFGAVCDAADLANYTGEVHIAIVVAADLYGASKYVTANFVSGTVVTPITAANGFIGSPKEGKFFADKSGDTACAGEENMAVVRLNYDDFNALLAAGDGTMTIEILASDAVKDVCEICCESGHPWTPGPCCTASPPCACPKGVGSYTEVALVYLDCDVWSIVFSCEDDDGCTDFDFCTGVEACVDGLCQGSTGNPCTALGLVCDPDFVNEDFSTGICVNCDAIGATPDDHDVACESADALFCNGLSTCVQVGSEYLCQQQPGTEPCLPELCYENLDRCLACSP